MEHDRSQRRAVDMGTEDFRPSTRGADSRGYQQSDNNWYGAQPYAQTYYQRQHYQSGPHHPSYQRRPPHWQVVADLKSEIQGLKILLKKEKDLNKAGANKNMLYKNIIEKLEEKLDLEHHKRLECETEIRELKEESQHLNPSCETQPGMIDYSSKSKQELVGVIEALTTKLQETESSDPQLDQGLTAENEALAQTIKNMQQESAKQTLALMNQLEEKTERCRELSSKFTAQEEISHNLQKKVEDVQRELELQMLSANQKHLEDVTHQHSETFDKNQVLVENLAGEAEKVVAGNESLEQEMKAMKEEVIISDQLLKAEQMEILESRCLVLSDEFKAQEKTNETPKKTVEDLPRQEELQGVRAEGLQKETEEANQTLQERAEVFEVMCEQEKISTWRKIKKAFTPHCRRQYKHLKKQVPVQSM